MRNDTLKHGNKEAKRVDTDAVAHPQGCVIETVVRGEAEAGARLRGIETKLEDINTESFARYFSSCPPQFFLSFIP